jgi:hypothetical protein
MPLAVRSFVWLAMEQSGQGIKLKQPGPYIYWAITDIFSVGPLALHNNLSGYCPKYYSIFNFSILINYYKLRREQVFYL